MSSYQFNQNFNDLVRLHLVAHETTELFSSFTRDNPQLPVYRDRRSGVIFIRDIIDSSEDYQSQRSSSVFDLSYYSNPKRLYNVNNRSLETRNLYVGKDVLDFGCGPGDFLIHIKPFAKTLSAIEIGQREINHLRSHSIRCENSCNSYTQESFDTIFAFHVIEHLDSQLKHLSKMRTLLRPSGHLYIEVPHARDILLSGITCDKFRDFSLWSQHLLLHTRQSLEFFLREAGYTNIEIFGIQRYPLSNHFYWLRNGLPSGHNGPYSYLDTPELCNAYQASLQRSDRTDTLIAIASP